MRRKGDRRLHPPLWSGCSHPIGLVEWPRSSHCPDCNRRPTFALLMNSCVSLTCEFTMPCLDNTSLSEARCDCWANEVIHVIYSHRGWMPIHHWCQMRSAKLLCLPYPWRTVYPSHVRSWCLVSTRHRYHRRRKQRATHRAKSPPTTGHVFSCSLSPTTGHVSSCSSSPSRAL